MSSYANATAGAGGIATLSKKEALKNPEYQRIAKELGIKKFNSENDIRQVQAAMQSMRGSAAGTATPAPTPAPTPSPSPAPAAGSVAAPAAYSNSTVPGNLVGAGTQSITDLLNRYGSNETIAGMGVGTLFDIGRTQANTGLAVAYNDAFLNSLGTYQKGLEDLKTGNTMKLLSAEGAVARDLVGKQGEEQRAGIRETGSQERLNLAETGTQQRLGYVTQGEQERLSIGRTGEEQRRTLATQGEQERLNLQQKGLEERRLRADARGAIRSQGARFYG